VTAYAKPTVSSERPAELFQLVPGSSEARVRGCTCDRQEPPESGAFRVPGAWHRVFKLVLEEREAGAGAGPDLS
jgi:hypothetical protein